MKRVLRGLSILASMSAFGDYSRIHDSKVTLSSRGGYTYAEVYLDDEGRWYLNIDDEGAFECPNQNIEKILHGRSILEVNAFLQNGKIRVVESDDKFTIRTQVSLHGGGPISGMIAYWLTKGVAYAGVAGAAAGTIAATGGIGASVVAGGVGTAVAGMGGAAATGVAGGALASGIAASTAATTAIGAGAVATQAVAAGGVVGAIETGAMGVGVFFAGIPFLP